MAVKYDVIVVGAGPAGIMAALSSANIRGRRVLILEKQPEPGCKLLLTGNGRCNLTNLDISDLSDKYPDSGPFLRDCLRLFGPQELIRFLAQNKFETKVEAGGRVLPRTGDASAVLSLFLRLLRRAKVKLLVSRPVTRLILEPGRVLGVETPGEKFFASRVIVACGGMSYPFTGSTGDAFVWAETAGHRIEAPRSALCGMKIAQNWPSRLSGISLPEVSGALDRGAGRMGDLLFTHYGVSGPLIFDLSFACGDKLTRGKQPVLRLDLLPKRSADELRWEWKAKQGPRVRCVTLAPFGLPARLGPVLTRLAEIDPNKPAAGLLEKEITRLINTVKGVQLKILSLRPLGEAMVTRGGVSTRQIDPRTMESKLVKGLYFCGETLDVAGLSGGYNLQAAFAAGSLAGKSATDLK